ncbi:hypothetical protein BUQ74_16745 [Leptospira weilii serovar Heyan]|uniref:RHS repeat-associated core domain protein n=1 Tax=Leptospira weilii str. UI 13098 TaxID=1088542 RepID=M6QT73_9LEPT|nr:hypothetical protein LEP1GSC108_0417 [Leptospira weilii str. UI 13098]OMI16196.1 hypothetical protein BUQ74_16745 [Leptospira weilii serovar Heyan]
MLGRLLQADSVVVPTNVNGMNRYMYVDGNPVNYRDPSGHVSGSGLMHMVNRIVGHAIGKDFHNGNSPSIKGIGKDLSKSILGKSLSKGFYKNIKKFQNWSQKAFFLRSYKSKLNKLTRKEELTLVGCEVFGRSFGFNSDSIKKCKSIAVLNYDKAVAELNYEYNGNPDYEMDAQEPNYAEIYGVIFILGKIYECPLKGQDEEPSASGFCEGT